jgi:acyl-CoA dehydrogenase
MSGAPFDVGTGAFRREVRRFVEQELAALAVRSERTGRFPRRAISACGRRQYLALDPARTAVVAEELVRCESLGLALSVFVQAGLIGPTLRRLATAAQQRTLVSALEAGRLVGAMAVSEPQAGSDFAALTCTATPDRRGYVVNGEKTYITAAGAADFLIVAVRVAGDVGSPISLLIVPTRTPGVHVRALATLGLATTAMARISFRRCRVPPAALLGERGGGYGYIQEALNRERLYGGIGAVAWAERALQKTSTYLRERRVFGQPLRRFQAIRHQMAELATELEASRQLNYATFARWHAGEAVTKEIAMIKLFTYRAVQRIVDACLQMHGGRGYLADHWTSRWVRDARALTIAAGTPEVMRDLIAAHLRL